jgi:hypothetical protein
MKRYTVPAILAVVVTAGGWSAARPTKAASDGWYVVTYSGGSVAGPFALLGDCTDEAHHLAERYSNVSSVCQYK